MAALVLVPVDHPWEFGWSALVAIGTLLLAVGTGWLGWQTRRLAQQTKREVASHEKPRLVLGRPSDNRNIEVSPDVHVLVIYLANLELDQRLTYTSCSNPGALRPSRGITVP
jgi:hypothetical protein